MSNIHSPPRQTPWGVYDNDHYGCHYFSPGHNHDEPYPAEHYSDTNGEHTGHPFAWYVCTQPSASRVWPGGK